jgi:hypothetical protein
VGEVVLSGIGQLAESFDLFQLLPPQLINIVVECQGIPFVARIAIPKERFQLNRENRL